jgi:hypothetical protein
MVEILMKGQKGKIYKEKSPYRLRSHPYHCLQGTRKNIKTSSKQNFLCLGRDMNQETSEYKARMLHINPVSSS